MEPSRISPLVVNTNYRFSKIAPLWEPIWDPSRPKVAIWFTPKDRSVSLDYEYVKISVTFGLEVSLSV